MFSTYLIDVQIQYLIFFIKHRRHLNPKILLTLESTIFLVSICHQRNECSTHMCPHTVIYLLFMLLSMMRWMVIIMMASVSMLPPSMVVSARARRFVQYAVDKYLVTVNVVFSRLLLFYLLLMLIMYIIVTKHIFVFT